MIKLGLLLGIKNNKYPENFSGLSEAFSREVTADFEDEAQEGVRVFDVLLLESTAAEIDSLERELALEADIAFAEAHEFEVLEDNR